MQALPSQGMLGFPDGSNLPGKVGEGIIRGKGEGKIELQSSSLILQPKIPLENHQ